MKLFLVAKTRDMWKYLVAMCAGAIIFLLCHDLYVSVNLRHDLKVLTTSDDYQLQYETCTKLLADPQYSIAAYGALTMNVGDRPATEQAKLACLDAIEHSDHFRDIPRSTFWATLDQNASVRLRSVELYERLLRMTHRGGLVFLTEKLLEEQDREIQDRKLEIICRYLFLSKEEVLLRFKSDGPEEVVASILERLKLLLPEGHVPPTHEDAFKSNRLDAP